MPGIRANTKDSVSANIVYMLWWGRQTVYAVTSQDVL